MAKPMPAANRIHGPCAPSMCTPSLATIAPAFPRILQALFPSTEKNLEADSHFSMHCTSQNDKP